jgi:hypothetical protein
MFGTLQVAYKHRAVIWRGEPLGVAAVGLPNVFVFQFLFTLLAPLIDLVLVGAIVAAIHEYATGLNDGIPQNLVLVLLYWAYFQVLEVATGILAISIDRRRDVWGLMPLLLIQRFYYRQLLYYTAVRVAFAACKGRMQYWGKLARTGTVAPAARALG